MNRCAELSCATANRFEILGVAWTLIRRIGLWFVEILWRDATASFEHFNLSEHHTHIATCLRFLKSTNISARSLPCATANHHHLARTPRSGREIGHWFCWLCCATNPFKSHFLTHHLVTFCAFTVRSSFRLHCLSCSISLLFCLLFLVVAVLLCPSWIWLRHIEFCHAKKRFGFGSIILYFFSHGWERIPIWRVGN